MVYNLLVTSLWFLILKLFFLLLLKCHLSKSANYNYAAIVAFAEMLSMFTITSLSLPG